MEIGSVIARGGVGQERNRQWIFTVVEILCDVNGGYMSLYIYPSL